MRDGKHIQLNIWDAAGQDKYKELTKMYYKGADVVLIVYDITNMTSFESAKNWYSDLKSKNDLDPMILLIGNKCDLESKRTVASSVARQYATSKGIQFFETSALTGANIKEVENYIINKKSNYDNINKEDYLQACELQIQILHLTSSLSSGSENEQRKKREQLVNLNKTLLHTNYMKKVQGLSEDALNSIITELRSTKEKTKEQRIKTEKTRLKGIFKDLDENKRKLVTPLIEKAAFMSIELDDLQAKLEKEGWTSEYQNGQNQWGTKKSPEAETYIALSKNYAAVIKQLTELVPAAKRKTSRLAALREE